MLTGADSTPFPWLRLREFELWDEAPRSYTHSSGHQLPPHAQVMCVLPVPTPFHHHSEEVVGNLGELLRSPDRYKRM